MPSKKRKKQGVPANTNPFCINVDNSINDSFWRSTTALVLPFFDSIGDDSRDATPVELTSPKLLQKEAERAVRGLYEADVVIGSFAVKERFAHIVPKDLRGRILVTRAKGPTCTTKDCYKLSEKSCDHSCLHHKPRSK